MPEHDTFDLETAFARLESDIAGLSSPRGADLAVATARRRRRRRTTIGAAAAVAAVAVGGVVLAQGVGTHAGSVEPAGQLPAPALLDGPHLTTATRGWTPAWGPQTDAGKMKLSQNFGGPCLALPGHGRSGVVELADDHVDVAFAVMSDYGSHSVREATDWFKIERQLAGCNGARLISSFSDVSGALGRTYRIDAAPSDTAPEYLWMVSTGRAIGVLKIFGQSDPLPSANDRPVADALLAAVQLPASYVGGRLNRSSTGQATIGMSAGDLSEALGGWPSGWSATDGNRAANSAPCGTDLTAGAAFGEGEALGGNGEQGSYGFSNATAARAAVESIGTSLAACSSTAYDVRSVPIQGGSVTVASGTGSAADVVWLVQDGNQFSYVVIPAGDTVPPDSVTQKVGDLLLSALRANVAAKESTPPPTATSMGPANGPSGTVARSGKRHHLGH
ncbi:MAG: hypothetical protein WB797_17045 [Nocardioides sp.]